MIFEKKYVASALLAAVLGLATGTARAAPEVLVGFSPEGSAQRLVLQTLDESQQSIRLMGYSFTSQMAFEVNQVFNLANEITSAAYSNAGAFGPQKLQWLSAFDVQKMTAGIQKERGYSIDSATVQEVIADHGKARKQFRRSRLRWRSPLVGLGSV